ncbi:MAG: hypothetical protein SOI13_01345 [Bifidobacterium mongoliense]|jgi:hypothetical protein|uniref:hypothetical protein n=1 Tax=Bifidobacterium mongoliense TaxID=518643 RepID=UPI002F35656C
MISQRTIAAALGLTQASVSNSLNGSGRTSVQMAETVIDYACTHGYTGPISAYGSRPGAKSSTPSRLPVQVAGGVVSRATFEWMIEALDWAGTDAFSGHGTRKAMA